MTTAQLAPDTRHTSPHPPDNATVAVVTGACGLIGTQIVDTLRAGGAAVIGVDTAAPIKDNPTSQSLDVSDPAALAALARRIKAEHGHLDYLVHAAALTGRAPGRNIAVPLAAVPLTLWEETLRVNLTAALLAVQALLPLLRLSNSPSIILIGSIQGLVPTADHTGTYAVSKTALIGLTRQLAAELAPDGITVNMISPGPTLDATDVDQLARTRDGVPTPLGRFGTAQEVASAVTAVLGPAFRHCTGAVIPIDGGEHLRPRTAPQLLSQIVNGDRNPDKAEAETR